MGKTNPRPGFTEVNAKRDFIDPSPGKPENLATLLTNLTYMKDSSSGVNIAASSWGQLKSSGKAATELRTAAGEYATAFSALKDFFEAIHTLMQSYGDFVTQNQKGADALKTEYEKQKGIYEVALREQDEYLELQRLNQMATNPDFPSMNMPGGVTYGHDVFRKVTNAKNLMDNLVENCGLLDDEVRDRTYDYWTALNGVTGAKNPGQPNGYQAPGERKFIAPPAEIGTFWDEVVKHAGAISGVLGGVALVTAFIPGGQPVAAVAGVLSAAFGVVDYANKQSQWDQMVAHNEGLPPGHEDEITIDGVRVDRDMANKHLLWDRVFLAFDVLSLGSGVSKGIGKGLNALGAVSGSADALKLARLQNVAAGFNKMGDIFDKIDVSNLVGKYVGKGINAGINKAFPHFFDLSDAALTALKGNDKLTFFEVLKMDSTQLLTRNADVALERGLEKAALNPGSVRYSNEMLAVRYALDADPDLARTFAHSWDQLDSVKKMERIDDLFKKAFPEDFDFKTKFGFDKPEFPNFRSGMDVDYAIRDLSTPHNMDLQLHLMNSKERGELFERLFNTNALDDRVLKTLPDGTKTIDFDAVQKQFDTYRGSDLADRILKDVDPSAPRADGIARDWGESNLRQLEGAWSNKATELTDDLMKRSRMTPDEFLELNRVTKSADRGAMLQDLFPDLKELRIVPAENFVDNVRTSLTNAGTLRADVHASPKAFGEFSLSKNYQHWDANLRETLDGLAAKDPALKDRLDDFKLAWSDGDVSNRFRSAEYDLLDRFPTTRPFTGTHAAELYTGGNVADLKASILRNWGKDFVLDNAIKGNYLGPIKSYFVAEGIDIPAEPIVEFADTGNHEISAVPTEFGSSQTTQTVTMNGTPETTPQESEWDDLRTIETKYGKGENFLGHYWWEYWKSVPDVPGKINSVIDLVTLRKFQ